MAAICLGLMVTSARGGSLDSPAGPESTASAMWTLENIYNVLDTRTTNVTKRAGETAFKESMGGPTNGTMHTLDEIMTLVTNRAPMPKSGQTTSGTPYDDGWYSTNVGVAWPNPRFTTNGVAADSNCVTDHLTGLMWLKNPDATTTNWAVAITYCNDLNGADGRGGYTDWRLPNRRELNSIVNLGQSTPSSWLNTQGFAGVQPVYYWSSTTVAGVTGSAWYVELNRGQVENGSKAYTYYVWPVRGVSGCE